jgi:hypothetical protein
MQRISDLHSQIFYCVPNLCKRSRESLLYNWLFVCLQKNKACLQQVLKTSELAFVYSQFYQFWKRLLLWQYLKRIISAKITLTGSVCAVVFIKLLLKICQDMTNKGYKATANLWRNLSKNKQFGAVRIIIIS